MAKDKSKAPSQEDIIKRCAELGFALVVQCPAPPKDDKITNAETVFFPEGANKGIAIK